MYHIIYRSIVLDTLSGVLDSKQRLVYPFSPASVHAETSKENGNLPGCKRMAVCAGGKMIRANHHVESYPSSGSPVEHGPRYIFRFDRHVFPMSDRKMADSIAAPVSDYLLAGITTRGWTVTTARRVVGKEFPMDILLETHPRNIDPIDPPNTPFMYTYMCVDVARNKSEDVREKRNTAEHDLNDLRTCLTTISSAVRKK